MDGATSTLKEKLQRLLWEAAEVSVALDRAEGAVQGAPHYSVIEARAHELGRRLSREIQMRRMSSVASTAADVVARPQCGGRRRALVKKRRVASIDGVVDLNEPVAHCPACRRDFFPPPDDARP
jgi:hypothetical protein